MREMDYTELYDLVWLRAEDIHPYEVMVGQRTDAEEEASRKTIILDEIVPCLINALGCHWQHRIYCHDRFEWWLLATNFFDDLNSGPSEIAVAIIVSPGINIAAFRVQGSQLDRERAADIKSGIGGYLRMSRVVHCVDYDNFKLMEDPSILRGLLVWARSGNPISIDFDVARERSSGVLREGCSVKYAWIDGHSKAFALTELCAVLDVSISGYRAWKRGGAPDRKRMTDIQTLAVIRAIHAELKGAYGSEAHGA